jgi:phytoene synthase
MDPVASAYRACADRVRRAGSSFYYGMRLLPAAKRNAMYAVYAWSRICDDAVDDYEGIEAEQHLAQAQALYERALDDDWAAASNPVSVALGHAIRHFDLSDWPFRDLLDGMRMDLTPRVYPTVEEFELYCRRVAGTVGTLCVEIFGYTHPSAADRAVDLGIALQMTNIVRDLKEDLGRGRLYLPLTDLEASGVSIEEVFRGDPLPGLTGLVMRQVDRAHSYYAKAADLFEWVEPDSLACLRLLHGVYRLTLDKIEEVGYDVWHTRVSVTRAEKLRVLGRALHPSTG